MVVAHSPRPVRCYRSDGSMATAFAHVYAIPNYAFACFPERLRGADCCGLHPAHLPGRQTPLFDGCAASCLFARGSRPELPALARAASKDTDATDLILVHSIPSGVLSIARYASGPAAIASWVGQLKNRHVPESIEQLAHGRTRIVFVRVHHVGEPAPEETWLRNNSVLFNEKHFQMGTVSDFRPKGMDTF